MPEHDAYLGPMTRAEYDAIDAANWSRLKELARSPRHYQHALTAPREVTDPMRVGLATHTAVYEPDRLLLEYAVWTGGRRQGGLWTAFVEANHDKTILREEDWERVCAIRDAVRSNAVAAPYLERIRAEVAVLWTDETTGLRCKARLDALSESVPAVVDLKTARGPIDARSFARTVASYGYHGQLGHYVRGVRAVTGQSMPGVLIAVESSAPFDVAVYELDDDSLYAGEELAGELLAKLSECRREKRWPGLYQEKQLLRLPAWYFAQGEEDGLSRLADAGEALMTEEVA